MWLMPSTSSVEQSMRKPHGASTTALWPARRREFQQDPHVSMQRSVCLSELGFPRRRRCSVPFSPTIVLRRHLYPAMAAAGVPRLGPTQENRTFHSFRHTFAKRALENGAQITWPSRHLGHSSLKVTTDIYGHWERAERKLQAAKMEGAFPV